MKSANYMKLVVEGNRNLTIPNMLNVAEAVGLSESETSYFEAMVLFNQSTLEIERSYYGRRLKALRAGKPASGKRVNDRLLLSQPHYPMVLVCLDNLEVNGAESFIAQWTGLETRLVEETIKTLLQEGIAKTAGQRYKLDSDHFVFQQKNMKAAQKPYLQEQLESSRSVFDSHYFLEAKFFAHTVTTGPDGVERLAARCDSFFQEISAETQREPIAEVIQINLQLFPTRLAAKRKR